MRKQYLVKPTILLIVSGIITTVSAGFLFVISSITIPLIFIGIIGIIFATVMPKKTNLGSDTKWWTKGFKLYLSKAERFRLGRMTPETFEKYLPYAMVLKVEKKWADRFKEIYLEPPSWYVPAGGYRGAFNIASFSKSFSGFTTNASSSIGTPRSSSSSSSSGFSGGFSGGGGGGGSASAG